MSIARKAKEAYLQNYYGVPARGKAGSVQRALRKKFMKERK